MKKTLITFLLVLMAAATAAAQNKITGKVTGESGAPLPGVTVMVTGTTNGTMTLDDGTFTLSVPNGATIDFICMGMTTVSKKYDGSIKTFNVTMQEDRMLLDESVAVGYGKQKKSSLTAAVSAIKGEDLMKGPATNISQLMAGRLTGISSVQESGEPGDDQAVLRVRGSVYAASYVVDGFPVDNINDIDPADIESVSVLKDGAAAAVYGLQAAGGVIVITTKKGDLGAAKITYNGEIGASMNANFPQFMNGPQFAYYYNVAQMMDQLANGEITSPDQYVTYFTKENIAAMTNGDPTDGWDNVDYINKVFGTGLTQKHSITIQGGNENARYFTSLGFMGQKGNIDNFNYNRYNVRTNVEGKLAKNFDYRVGLSGILSDRHTPAFLSGGSDDGDYEVGWFSVSRQAIQMHPYLPETYDGYYTGSVQTNQSMLVSPLAAIYESGYKNTRTVNAALNASLRYNAPFLPGFFLSAAGSFDWTSAYNKNFSNPYTLMSMTKDDNTGTWSWSQRTDCPHISDNVNNLSEASSYSQLLVGQFSAGYANSFGKNNLDLLALAEIRDSKSNNLAAYVKDLPFASLPELSNGTAINDPVSGGSWASRNVGFVFRAKYDYANKYLAEITGRCDGSYKFSGMSGNRWGFFPSASLGWRMSKEDFMSDVDCIDDLKIRASFGLLGNDSVSEYSFLSTYSPGSKVTLGSLGSAVTTVPAYYSTTVPNTDLTWEKTQSWNAGFDLTMWKGMLGVELDGFYNYTYDMLTYQSTGYPASMGGYYSTWVNSNAIDAAGVDLKLTHRNSVMVAGKPFYYDLMASVTYSHTRWLKYNDDPNIVDYRKVTGTTYGSILCWQADGLYRSEEEIDNSAWYGTRPNVGDIKYVDLNGDGKIDEDDKGYFGRSNRPQLTFGLNLNINWNGFDFNAQFTGGALFDVSMTGTYYNSCDDNTIWTQTFKEGGNSPLFLVQNAYSIYNTDAEFPRLTLAQTNHGGDNGLSSTFWIRDGKYLRLKTCQLGYTIPKHITEKIRLGAFRVFVEGQNLFTIDGLPEGIDPESPGVNNGYYPQQLLLMGGITLSF